MRLLAPEDKTTFWQNPDQLEGVMRLVFFNADNVAGVVNHPNYTRTTILVRTSLSRSSDIAASVDQIRVVCPEDISLRNSASIPRAT